MNCRATANKTPLGILSSLMPYSFCTSTPLTVPLPASAKTHRHIIPPTLSIHFLLLPQRHHTNPFNMLSQASVIYLSPYCLVLPNLSTTLKCNSLELSYKTISTYLRVYHIYVLQKNHPLQ